MPPTRTSRRILVRAGAALAAGATVSLALSTVPAAAGTTPQSESGHRPHGLFGKFSHLVVIYEENHSFDNIYGHWGDVGGQRVDGLQWTPNSRTKQVNQAGNRYRCLPQDDVNLTSPPLSPIDCGGEPASHFPNKPFLVDNYIAPGDKTCPPLSNLYSFPNGVSKTDPPADARPGGCTRDLVHRFYQEQYQLNGGKQNRYVTGSDALGLTMGVYDTKRLPIWQYLHSSGAPNYVIADRFFQAAFGGSYLNHQYLIAAQPPHVYQPPTALHSVVDSNGMPTSYPQYKATGEVRDAVLTQECGTPTTKPGLACGHWGVNTMQPPYQPFSTHGAQQPAVNDTTRAMNIGDRMSDAGISWAWYSGGWDNASGNVGGPGWTNSDTACTAPGSSPNPTFPYCPDATFQYHHQPFNYFARYAPGTVDRAQHLKDEQEFIASAKAGTLPAVSFVKPLGQENEHPGYASESTGSDHLVDLLKTITSGPEGKDTLVVVTYDEFGGQWDHVPPPGMGTPGPSDQFGPGTRIPALVVSAGLHRSGVDHTVYDTTSIMATIEHAFRLAPVDHPRGVVPRDRRVADLRHVILTGLRGH